ncbi:MAG: GntR family transcriptional regulator [Lentisphaerae bacterium]|nr:GntR family transcriptional regulator [Lentisphaerota bacterium]
MTKYASVMRILKRRIAAGDYAGAELPGEIRLADELGVGRITMRRAIKELLDEGLLTRAPSRRLIVNTAADHPVVRKVIGLMAPAFATPITLRWRYALEQAAARRNDVLVRAVDVIHDDDPSITETLKGFDGVFVVLGSGVDTDAWRKRLYEARARVVSLETDMSADGIVSVCMEMPSALRRVLDHLKRLGHRRIDCLNVQPAGPVIASRIATWRLWCAENGIAGELIDAPVKPFEDPLPKAHGVIRHKLRTKTLRATALLTTIEQGALGAMRALADAGLKPGRDVSVCSAVEDYRARYAIPSITCVRAIDPSPYYARCLDWMCSDSPWNGPLLLKPRSRSIFKGDSTGPPPPIPHARRGPPRSWRRSSRV